MSNDWLRAVRLTADLAEGARKSSRVAAAAVGSARLAADAVDVSDLGHVDRRPTSLYPQFLDPGIPLHTEQDED